MEYGIVNDLKEKDVFGKPKVYCGQNYENWVMAQQRYAFTPTGMTGNKVEVKNLAHHEQLLEMEHLGSIARRLKKENFFDVQEQGNGEVIVQKTKLYNAHYRNLLVNFSYLRGLFPGQKLKPDIELLMKHVTNCTDKYGSSILFQIPDWDDERKKKIAVIINEMADNFRREASSVQFKKSAAAWRDAVNKNARSVLGYIEELFDEYSNLLVLRMDLGYRCWTEQMDNEKFDIIKKHLDMLLKKINGKNFVNHKVGYVLKTQPGPEKQLQVHCMFFFDGSKVRNDEWLAGKIGEYWVSDVTQGLGVYYNCNRMKSNYRGCGTGMVSRDDFNMMFYLKKAALYLTMADHWISLVRPESVRLLRCGQQPSAKRNSKRKAA